ncbi:MAG: FkbM family methyltransferase [Methylocystis sp.]|nr:FkbM family methyltransferase [Methylocystis sp.]
MKNLMRNLVNRIGYDVVKLRNSNAELSTHLMNVFAAKNIDCVLDVGANSGQYGKFLREIGFKGYIVSFEPVMGVFERLEENAKSDRKWICYNLALGDQQQEKTINVYESTVFSSFLEASDYSKGIWNSLNSANTETVHVTRLDDIFQEIVARTGCDRFFFKMDTQGYDINVFRGGIGSLCKVEALQSEISLIAVYKEMPSSYGVLTEFHSHDYFISGMYPINRDESLAVIEYDCVLVRRAPGAGA